MKKDIPFIKYPKEIWTGYTNITQKQNLRQIVTRVKKEKGLIHLGNITIIQLYAPNKRTAKYMKQKGTELKREIDNTVIYLETLILHF